MLFVSITQYQTNQYLVLFPFLFYCVNVPIFRTEINILRARTVSNEYCFFLITSKIIF